MKLIFRPILIYLLASSFYLYEFSLQVAPGVIVNELMQAMETDAVGLAWLAAAYYYAYAPMQIPAGILFDKFGPRRLISGAIILCVLGTLLFSGAHTLFVAALGRFLVGIGSAFSFVGILVLISNWFAHKYYAFLIGIAQLMSTVGVISGEYLLAHYMHYYGWRQSLLFIAGSGLMLAIFVWLVVRDKPEELEGHANADPVTISASTLLMAFVHICRMPQTWWIALYAFVIWGPMTFFASLWSIEYVKVRYALDTDLAIHYQFYLWLGVAVGCPILGAFSNLIRRRVVPMQLCAVLGLVASSFLLSKLQLSLGAVSLLFFIIGFSAAGQTISFGLIGDIQPKQYLGSASGFNNMATVAGGAVLQPILGVLLKHYWTGTFVDGRPVYSLDTFQKALVLLPICYLTALILTRFLIKESYCRPYSRSR